MPVPFENFPTEVQYRVFEFLANPDALCLPPRANKETRVKAEHRDRTLSNLCQVSRRCRAIAQKLLFRRVMLTYESPYGPLECMRRTHDLLAYCQSHPNIAGSIGALELFIEAVKCYRDVISSVVNIMQACTQLRQVWIYMISEPGSTSYFPGLVQLRDSLDKHTFRSFKLYVNRLSDLECLPPRKIPHVFVGIYLDNLVRDLPTDGNGHFILSNGPLRVNVLRLYGYTCRVFRENGSDLEAFLGLFKPPPHLSLRKCTMTFQEFNTIMVWAGKSLEKLDCREFFFRENGSRQPYQVKEAPHGSSGFIKHIPNLASVAFSRYLPYGFQPLQTATTIEWDAFDSISLSDLKRWMEKVPANRLRRILLRTNAVEAQALNDLMDLSLQKGFEVCKV